MRRRTFEITMGEGSPSKKTMGVRGAKEMAQESGFNYPSNVAITPQFFRKFMERSGALEATGNEAKLRMVREKFSITEKKDLLDAYHQFPEKGTAGRQVMVRLDEPWTVSCGIGFSDEVKNDAEFLRNVKISLESSRTEDAIAFRELKGLPDEFGILLMEKFTNFTNEDGKIVDRGPAATVNFLGEAGGKSLVQYSSNMFLNDNDADARIIGKGEKWPSLLHGLKEKAERLVKLGGFCSFEAVRSNIDGRDSWTLVQYEKRDEPRIEEPKIEPDRMIWSIGRAVGSALSQTSGVSECSHRAGFRFVDNGLSEYNRTHRGYLFIANLDLLLAFWGFPLKCYSNAGAILATYEEMKRTASFEYLSHISGVVRALGIPFLTMDKNLHADTLDRIRNSNGLLCFADEFNNKGFIARNG